MSNILMPLFHLLLLLQVGTASTVHTDSPSALATMACQYFETANFTSIMLPSDPSYINVSTENWSSTAWATPTCIVHPSEVAELQQLVSYLKLHETKFAIRSGGHMPSPFAANIDDGVLIDLSAFKQVDYDAESSTVIIGTGNRWSDVYSALDAFNITVVGGRVLDVGVGGLTLGSGLSYLSDLYGLVCDNIVEHEIVLANGTFIKASEEVNEDLHWALKGGSNNFGIVTAFKLNTYPIHEVWGGIKSYSLNQLPALFSAVMQYQSRPSKDPYANFMLQAFPFNASVGAVLNMVYLKPVESPEAFAPFYNISTTADTTKIQTLTEMMSGQGVPDIPRWDWFATSFTPNSDLYTEIQQILITAPELHTLSSLNSGTLAFGLQPISESVIRAGISQGGNALGLEAVNQTWFVLDMGWNLSEDDVAAHEAVSGLNNQIRDAAIQRGHDIPYIFMNDASYDQEVISSYGQKNVAKLKDVQQRYDPDCVFQSLVPGGFKIYT